MDPLARRKSIRLIRDWARAGKSIIVSSHILHEIESMTANILLINNGRILAEGRRPSHPRPDRRASAHRLRTRGESARPGARVPRARRRAEPEVRAGCGHRRDREAGRVLCAADRAGGERRVRRDRRGDVARRQPAGGLPVPGEVKPNRSLGVQDLIPVKLLASEPSSTSMTQPTSSARCLPRRVPRLEPPGVRPVDRRDAVVAPDDLHGARRRRAGLHRAAAAGARRPRRAAAGTRRGTAARPSG